MSRIHVKIALVLLSAAAISACDRGSDTRENRYLSNDQSLMSDSSASASASDSASAEACRASAEALDQMVELSRGDLEYRPKAELVIGEAAWNQLPGSYRVSLAQIVAHVAACPDGDPANTVVTVRARGADTVLAQGKPADFAKTK